jgi:hypothetical protein
MEICNIDMLFVHAMTACLKWIIFPLLLALGMIPTNCWAEEAVSMVTNIARAWQNRENRVLTLDCEWSAEEVCGAGTWVYHDEQGKQFALPSNDLTTNALYHFRLQGHRKMHFEYTGPQPIQETRSFETREYISITDGEEQKCFYGKEEESEDPRFPPRGFVNKNETLPETSTTARV